ncbi:unnamed protein product, partial [Sphacelaria rigidula]
VQWAHENDAPWDSHTHRLAMSCKQDHVVKYLIENGCPEHVD